MSRLLWLLRRLWWMLAGRPAVRLYVCRFRVQAVDPLVAVPGLGTPVNVFVERIRAWVRVGPNREPPLVRPCWVDTGAYLTIIPELIWRLVEPEIIWLHASPGDNLPIWLTRVSLATGSFQCRPGLIRLQFVDGDGRSLPQEL